MLSLDDFYVYNRFNTLGMRKEWIRSGEEKIIKRIQSEKNRKTKRPLQVSYFNVHFLEISFFVLFRCR